MDTDILLRRIAPYGLDCGRRLDNPQTPAVRHLRS